MEESHFNINVVGVNSSASRSGEKRLRQYILHKHNGGLSRQVIDRCEST